VGINVAHKPNTIRSYKKELRKRSKMALQKTKQLNNGFEVSYWRIVRLSHLAKDGTEVVLGGFKNKETSDNLGDQAIVDVANFNFDLDKSLFLEGNAYEEAYKLIKESKLDEDGKETNWFADSEDLI